MEGKKHSKERESGVSEWKSAGVGAWAKQTGGEIAEAGKRREMLLFIHTHLTHYNHHPSPKHTTSVLVRRDMKERESERRREPVPPFLIWLSQSSGPKVTLITEIC